MTALSAVKFTSWWLCGRGLHIWETWEYEDGTVAEECASCQMQAVAVKPPDTGEGHLPTGMGSSR